MNHIVSIRKSTEIDENLLIEKLSRAKVDGKTVHDLANVSANAITAMNLAEIALKD